MATVHAHLQEVCVGGEDFGGEDLWLLRDREGDS
jgi:hypothetical protein